MKKFLIIAGCVVTGIVILSCNNARRNPGRAYMPDMTYSVAYETYAPTDERLGKIGAHYTGLPVHGTIARGDMFPYNFKNDSSGTLLAANDVNPLPPLDERKMVEATRLYLVNCAICHGVKLDGNGPLFKGGDGPYTAKPATLVGDPTYTKMTEGTMFHSITYGKNMMGSYASQLSSEQRWMIVHYIKDQQNKKAGGEVTDTTGAGQKKPDTTNLTATATPK